MGRTGQFMAPLCRWGTGVGLKESRRSLPTQTLLRFRDPTIPSAATKHWEKERSAEVGNVSSAAPPWEHTGQGVALLYLLKGSSSSISHLKITARLSFKRRPQPRERKRRSARSLSQRRQPREEEFAVFLCHFPRTSRSDTQSALSRECCRLCANDKGSRNSGKARLSFYSAV